MNWQTSCNYLSLGMFRLRKLCPRNHLPIQHMQFSWFRKKTGLKGTTKSNNTLTTCMLILQWVGGVNPVYAGQQLIITVVFSLQIVLRDTKEIALQFWI